MGGGGGGGGSKNIMGGSKVLKTEVNNGPHG